MKQVLLIALIIVVALAVGFSVVVRLGLRQLRLEDDVPQRFKPVIVGLFNFEAANGASPQDLLDLVPQYLEVVPTSESIHNVDYARRPDGSNWMLSVTCQIGRGRRMYCWRTDESISLPDGWITSGMIHGWHVLKNQKE